MQFSVDDMCRAGCATRRAIRLWESEGLLGEVKRTAGNTRRFTAEQMDRAKIIAAAQFGGWKLEEIKLMVEAYDTDVYEALLLRLSSQVRAAERLAESLPMPGQAVEYDL
jgi:DNA-binding transcriptional MerR regulator